PSSFLCLSLLFISLSTADGFLSYSVDRCQFNSTELKDIEYIRSVYYNKLEIFRFSSSLGKFVGYTEYGVKQADYRNNDKAILSSMKAQKETYCHNNIGVDYSAILSKSVQPSIKVSWLRDGKEITSDVTSTEEMADGDWYYQTHSHLEYTPRSGEKISCVVEHASLKEPLKTDWDPSMPESERNNVAIGASGLILGLILSLAGFIYYKRKARGRILVPSN
nr:class II histocompatibility antigen beta chain - Aulonocara hansbaenschi [Aulonocara hansbaenschi]